MARRFLGNVRRAHEAPQPTLVATLSVSLIVAVVGCSAPVHTRSAFDGRETDAWLAFDVELPEGNPSPVSLLYPFKARADALGCRTETRGNHINPGPIRYGLAVYCEDGGITLIPLPGRMRVGCEKPTTRASCEGLLTEISEARPRNYDDFGF